MASISNGTIKVENASQVVRGVYSSQLTSYQGPFPVDSTVTGTLSGFVGDVCFYDGGTGEIRYTSNGAAQPVLGERITTSGTASGTIGSFINEPSFLPAHDGDWLYVLRDGAITHYMIGAIPTKSQLQLTTTYAGTSSPEEEYQIGRSRTPVYGWEYPEDGDIAPLEQIKRMAFDIEETLASGIGISSLAVENSLTISGIPVATAGEFDALTVTLTNNVSTLRSEALSGFFSTTSGGTVTIVEFSPYVFTIESMVGKTRTGAVSGTLKIDDVGVTGIKDTTWPTSQTTRTATAANTVGLGSRLTLTMSGVSGVADFGYTIVGSRSL